MRKTFYTDLFAAEVCCPKSTAELLNGLPRLSEMERENTLSLEEVTVALGQMASGEPLDWMESLKNSLSIFGISLILICIKFFWPDSGWRSYLRLVAELFCHFYQKWGFGPTQELETCGPFM